MLGRVLQGAGCVVLDVELVLRGSALVWRVRQGFEHKQLLCRMPGGAVLLLVCRLSSFLPEPAAEKLAKLYEQTHFLEHYGAARKTCKA